MITSTCPQLTGLKLVQNYSLSTYNVANIKNNNDNTYNNKKGNGQKNKIKHNFIVLSSLYCAL